MSKKILIVNQPLNNRGDESAHKALIRSMICSLPDAYMTVLFVDDDSDTIRQFVVQHPHVSYRNISSLPGFGMCSVKFLRHKLEYLGLIHPTVLELISLYMRCDIILCAPGGICMGGFMNWFHIYVLKLAKILHKPIVYYGRSFGPFDTSVAYGDRFKKLSLELLHYFSFLSIRDKVTEQLAEKLGIKYVSTVDTAFLESPLVSIPTNVTDTIGNENYVIFVPNSLNWHFAFKSVPDKFIMDFYCKMIDLTHEQFPKHKIVMLPQLFNYEKLEDNDIYFFEKLLAVNVGKNLVVLSDQLSSDIQQTIIKSADLVIGARYHSVVFSINSEIPLVALSYEAKIAGLLMTLGYEENMVDITRSFSSVEAMDKTLAELKKCLSSSKCRKVSNRKAKDLSKQAFEALINII